MGFPDFFAAAPTITLRDPLAVFLGASRDGTLTYGYSDVVKLAGHSCPTVAGAYLMLRRGLAHLYGNEVPERGNVLVYMRDGREEGTTGVIASVATLLTGAAPETGFAGIAGRFGRRDLLQFDAPIDGLMALRRRDTGRGVLLDLDASHVPPEAQMRVLLSKAVTGEASEAEQARFGAVWQERVERMLTRHADDPGLVHVREWQAAA